MSSMCSEVVPPSSIGEVEGSTGLFRLLILCFILNKEEKCSNFLEKNDIPCSGTALSLSVSGRPAKARVILTAM